MAVITWEILVLRHYYSALKAGGIFFSPLENHPSFPTVLKHLFTQRWHILLSSLMWENESARESHQKLCNSVDFQCVSSAPERAARKSLGMILKVVTLLLLSLFYNLGESYTLTCRFVSLPSR